MLLDITRYRNNTFMADGNDSSSAVSAVALVAIVILVIGAVIWFMNRTPAAQRNAQPAGGADINVTVPDLNPSNGNENSQGNNNPGNSGGAQ